MVKILLTHPLLPYQVLINYLSKELYYNQPDTFNDKPISQPIESKSAKQLSSDPRLTVTETPTEPKDSANNLVTYTISCPPEWQLDLSRMVNCFVLFKDLNTASANCDVRLKCSFCRSEFYSLSELTAHKEMNELCKNVLNINQEIEPTFGNNEPTRKKNQTSKF